MFSLAIHTLMPHMMSPFASGLIAVIALYCDDYAATAAALLPLRERYAPLRLFFAMSFATLRLRLDFSRR